jgi:hypothetical protein
MKRIVRISEMAKFVATEPADHDPRRPHPDRDPGDTPLREAPAREAAPPPRRQHPSPPSTREDVSHDVARALEAFEIAYGCGVPKPPLLKASDQRDVANALAAFQRAYTRGQPRGYERTGSPQAFREERAIATVNRLSRARESDDGEDLPDQALTPSGPTISKERAEYRYADDLASSCGQCRSFEVEHASCLRVIGVIRPIDTCRLFEPLRLAAGPR